MKVEKDGAYMSTAEFERLPEYSCTIPTGVTIGKRWRRREPYMLDAPVIGRWYLCEYVETKDKNLAGIVKVPIFLDFEGRSEQCEQPS